MEGSLEGSMEGSLEGSMEGSLERGQWSTGSDDKEVFELGQPACQCAKIFFPALAYTLVEINRHCFPSQIGDAFT